MNFEIRFSELVTLHTAVIKTSDLENILMDNAAYPVME
jgi:hypothetical protein